MREQREAVEAWADHIVNLLSTEDLMADLSDDPLFWYDVTDEELSELAQLPGACEIIIDVNGPDSLFWLWRLPESAPVDFDFLDTCIASRELRGAPVDDFARAIYQSDRADISERRRGRGRPHRDDGRIDIEYLRREVEQLDELERRNAAGECLEDSKDGRGLYAKVGITKHTRRRHGEMAALLRSVYRGDTAGQSAALHAMRDEKRNRGLASYIRMRIEAPPRN